MKVDPTLIKMVYAYKVSTFLKNIKVGVEVPHSTNHALKMDQTEENNHWKEVMEIEINQLHAMKPLLSSRRISWFQKDIKGSPTIAYMMSSLMVGRSAGLLLEVT